MKRLPIILCIVLPLGGCALFEPTVRPETGLFSRQRSQNLTPELARESSILQRDIQRTWTIDAATSGPVLLAESISETYGLPPVPRDSVFTATSEFAENGVDLNSFHNATGSGVTAGQQNRVNEGSYSAGAAAQVERADISARLISDAVAKVAEAAVGIRTVEEQQRTERRRIEADRDVKLAELAPEEPAEEPEAPAEPETAPGEASPQ